ncbi:MULTISPECIES: FixH family protein [unclassified Luteimonas]|uniref:FixH family protein n=1 Tax=unclassified Luteimonas TaxID=2629088 RepID=UPI00160133A0|nr:MULTISPECIES: FixH family protein [unclassified Luteimonas]MBB1471979.1 FixH family protein [Luteimonas sp. MC1782]MBB6599292.1 FixH family protein [Luteimonas sp. MC1825]QOC87009.1 FixH family protein [Luteimonas sp. MC1825]
MTDDRKRPFWREPMMWLVIGLPLASVVAGVILVGLATRDSSDAVGDVVQRTAQIQVSDLSPDARARDLGLSAIIRVDEGYVEVLPVTGQFDRGQPLRIVLRHPSLAASDVELRAAPGEYGWRAEAGIGLDHDWKLELMPEGMAWRLQGRLPKGQRAAHVKPAFSGEQE